MAYTKAVITNYGLRSDFMKLIKDFFINNGVVPFEIKEDNLEEELPNFTVEYGNLNIKVAVPGASASSTQFEISSKINDEEYVTNTTANISHSYGDSASSMISRKLQFFIAKSDESVLLQVAGYRDTAVSNGTTIIYAALSNGENIIGTGSSTINYFKEIKSQQQYTVRAFHTGSNVDGAIILSNTLAVNNNAGVYYADVMGLKSAGGAKQYEYYVTGTDIYYGLLTDVVIPLGDNTHYTGD